jgi:MOSC domain-containing protein YiiM
MRILSVNLAAPQPSVTRDEDGGGLTGINKIPTTGRVPVTAPQAHEGGLAGDSIFFSGHGGPYQAVYAYAREDYDWWQAKLGRDLRNGYFGENLTTAGLDVCEALIGERWRIGPDLVVQATYARIPCVTFQGHMGEPQWVKRFTERGRPGTYLRVIEPGEVGEGDEVTVVHRPDHGVTIAEMFRMWTSEQDRLPELLEIPDLPEPLRARALRHLNR